MDSVAHLYRHPLVMLSTTLPGIRLPVASVQYLSLTALLCSVVLQPTLLLSLSLKWFYRSAVLAPTGLVAKDWNRQDG